MTPLQRSLSCLAIFFCLFTDCLALKCYDTNKQSVTCEPIQLFCIKFINGTTITRGCANVNDYCSDEDPGCYPEREENGVTQKWCCCEKDLCNSVSAPSVFFVVASLIFSLW